MFMCKDFGFSQLSIAIIWINFVSDAAKCTFLKTTRISIGAASQHKQLKRAEIANCSCGGRMQFCNCGECLRGCRAH